MTMTEELPFHIPKSFKVGDRVVVTSNPRKVRAWYGYWNQDNDGLIGSTQKIIDESTMVGFYCQGPAGTRCFPSCALARPGKQSVVIEVPSIGG